jgi:predicted Zn-dependent peptidase
MTTAMFWRRDILPNGLRVLFFPKRNANTTQLSVAVEFGSNQEPPENAGVAHFLEHMIAGGSTKRVLLSRDIESSGGILDLYTDHEHMMCTMDFLPEQIANASNILSELLFNHHFEEEKFYRERKIILNELAEALDVPSERIEDLMLKNLFRDHPIKRPVGGFPKTVKQLTLNHLRDAHKTNYVPENMILILTGNFSEESEEIVLKNFANRCASGIFSRKYYPIEANKQKMQVVKKKAGISQTYLSIGAKTVCSTHKDVAALDVASAVLNGGTSSRLFIELREKHALTYDVNSDQNNGMDFGYYSVNCAVKNKNLSKTISIILKELGLLRTQKLSEAELERSKNLIIGEILRGMDNPQEAIEIITYLEMQYKNENALLEYIAKIKAVTSEKIIEVANNYLQEDMLSTIILEPTK